jgi:hypothetical protein
LRGAGFALLSREEEIELTQLNNVANDAHDQESHADGLGDAQELALVGYRGDGMLAIVRGEEEAASAIVRSNEGTTPVEERSLGGNVRLLHLVMNWRPSLTNSRGISRNSLAWSIVRIVCGLWRL